MTSIPFLDLGRLHALIRDELDAAYGRVVSSSAFVLGGEVEAFEDAFAAAHGAPGGVGCGSGTDALLLALLALGVGPGDEVVVPAMTFVATAEAILHAGAVPVLADVDPTTLLLDASAVERVRSARTKAVIPVHLYGHVVSLEQIDRWRRDGLVVVEDAAQAHLATWHGRSVGTAGDLSCFSFYPGKNLGALGDGGIVLGHEPAVLERVRALRDHGSTQKYVHTIPGWCSRLDALQAAFLDVKLRHLGEWTDARRQVAEWYRKRLPGGLLVPWEEGAVHHLLAVRVPGAHRERILTELSAAGIGCGVHYPIALSRQPALEEWARSCPAAESAADELLSLPMDPLMTTEEVDAVCEALLRTLDC
ncbi:MAG: DegT/DnrJ/EryC1/StrS family aminotransferase [Acidimicrobiia bacterium]|nr:DegT/DnrJ/EryC1/StrS family aminotransferase [Acidimicrobiia bacterium]